jgi:hypothetical protein
VSEAHELDERILKLIRTWAHGEASDATNAEPNGRERRDSTGESACDAAGFEQFALRVCAYQLATNPPYARFAAAHGFTPARLPRTLLEIPAVPAAAFKDATLATFDVGRAALEFHTSGTSGAAPGRHFFERAALYDAALLAAFDRFMLADGVRLRYLNLVPNPRYRPHSSLGYMMGQVSVLRGDGRAGWFLNDDPAAGEQLSLDADAFVRALAAACSEDRPVCIATTAFAAVALVDALGERGLSFRAPQGSRVMETGGFKGRSRIVERDELYARLSALLGIPEERIVAEYGMTELASQYYDAPDSRGPAPRVKVAPPWLRTLVVDERGRELAPGETGFLRHIDLANRSSVCAIETEDRGYALDGGIVLLGRDSDAPPRGCSLDAEELLGRSR